MQRSTSDWLLLCGFLALVVTGVVTIFGESIRELFVPVEARAQGVAAP